MLLERPPHPSLAGKRDNSIPKWTAAYPNIATAWRDHDRGGHLLLLAGRANVARPLLVYTAAVCIQRLAAWNHAALGDLVSSMGAIVDATAETAYDPGSDLNAAIHFAAERVAAAYPDYARDCADIVRGMIPWRVLADALVAQAGHDARLVKGRASVLWAEVRDPNMDALAEHALGGMEALLTEVTGANNA